MDIRRLGAGYKPLLGKTKRRSTDTDRDPRWVFWMHCRAVDLQQGLQMELWRLIRRFDLAWSLEAPRAKHSG